MTQNVELKDGRLWTLIRTGSGVLWQSYSDDKGKTWTGKKKLAVG